MTDPRPPRPSARARGADGTRRRGPWHHHCSPSAGTALHPRATHIRARRPRNRSSILDVVLRVLLTNDDGIEADGLQALRRALLEVDDVELAVIAPDANQSATARSITTRRPLWVRGGRLRRRHRRLRHRRHAGRLRALRLARAGRRLHRRPDRLRHQPRLQPRRRHHLLGHRRRRARGRHPRHPRHRRLAAVQRARDGLPARRSLRLRRRRRVHRADRGGDRRRPAAGGHAAQHQRAGRRDRRRRGRARSASASTATSSR